jgi:mannose-6-phosphate isomerase-like protein (cupin superfamily)
VQTLTPGCRTPIHRLELEEIFITVKGSGTVYVAPKLKKFFPGEPEAFPFASNSTFSVPFNSVHQVGDVSFNDLLSVNRLECVFSI